MHITSYVGSPSSVTFHLSRDVVAVLLFCLLGLTASVAVLSLIPLDQAVTLLAY